MNSTTDTQTKARCYMEFCCNEATFEVELLDRGTLGVAIPWGWCEQHKHHSWTMRQAHPWRVI